jgi:hypothetical protein
VSFDSTWPAFLSLQAWSPLAVALNLLSSVKKGQLFGWKKPRLDELLQENHLFWAKKLQNGSAFS